METKQNVVISLCDESLAWSLPFAERSGWTVIAVDPKHRDRTGQIAYSEARGPGSVIYYGDTVDGFIRGDHFARLQRLVRDGDAKVRGVIAQPVCTQFAGAGARHWKRKDAEQPELLAEAKRLVSDCLHVVASFAPDWWIMENPVGRMGRVCGLGKPVMTYQPHQYAQLADDRDAERYTKRTCLWGTFDAERLKGLRGGYGPLVWGKGGNTSKMHACYGGSSAETKEARSKTPTGFAHAFWLAHGERYVSPEQRARTAARLAHKRNLEAAYDGPIPAHRR